MLDTIDQGAGHPLLLVHGFPLSKSMWRYQCDALAEHCRVIAPDLRGFGSSASDSIRADTGIAMHEFADELAQLLDDLEITEPVTLTGYSMGGYIAWQFFRRHRQRLRALVLVDTKADVDTPEAREIRYRMAEGVTQWGSAQVAQLMVGKLFSPVTTQSNQPLVQEVAGIIGSTNPATIATAQRGMAERHEALSLLPAIDLPTLYVCGEDDQISPPEEMRAMADSTPGAQYVGIPSAGHMSPMENPEAVNSAIIDFLDNL